MKKLKGYIYPDDPGGAPLVFPNLTPEAAEEMENLPAGAKLAADFTEAERQKLRDHIGGIVDPNDPEYRKMLPEPVLEGEDYAEPIEEQELEDNRRPGELIMIKDGDPLPIAPMVPDRVSVLEKKVDRLDTKLNVILALLASKPE